MYLIPANTKRGSLIFNLFTKFDLIVLGSGLGITLLMIFVLSPNNLTMTFIILGPGLLSAFLVTPIPNYHNVMTVITSLIMFLTGRRNYIWKGWCLYEQEKEDGKK